MATYTTEIMPYGLRAKGFTWYAGEGTDNIVKST